jgi:hypothetical protein
MLFASFKKNEEYKAREIAVMHQIYGSALITIGAISASNAEEGFLIPFQYPSSGSRGQKYNSIYSSPSYPIEVSPPLTV